MQYFYLNVYMPKVSVTFAIGVIEICSGVLLLTFVTVKSDESLFLLATSYYRSGLRNHAYSVLKDHPGSSPQCRFLFASCALELDK